MSGGASPSTVEVRSRPRYETSVRRARREPSTRRQRALALSVAVLASCAAPERVTLELPEEALASDAATLILALEYGGDTKAVVVDRRRASLPALPNIEAWAEDEPATYTVALYAESIDALEIDAGPVQPAAAGAPTRNLPAPERAFRAELSAVGTAWTPTSDLPPALATRALPRVSRPLDCGLAVSRGLSLGAEDRELSEIAATSRTSALTMARIDGRIVLAELLDAGQLTPRPLPPPIQRLSVLIAAGRFAYGRDLDGRLVVLEPDGTLRAFSPPGVASELVATLGGEVYFTRSTRIYALTAGSTRAVALPELPDGPERFEHVALGPSGQVLVSVANELWAQRDGRWRRDFVVDPIDGEIDGVAADDLGLYAVSDGAVWRRLDDRGFWEEYDEGRTYFDLDGILPYGQGRLVVYGTGGQMFVQPNPVTRHDAWCTLPTGTFREIERASLDPSGATVFGIDRRDNDGSEDSALVVRIELPR